MKENVQHYLNEAYRFEKNGKYLHALQFYNKVLRADKFNKLAIVNLSLLYEKMDNIEATFNFLDSYTKCKSQDDDILLFYTEFLIKENNYEKAVDVLSLVSNKEKLSTTFLLGVAYYNLKDYKIAKVKFTDFCKISKSSEMLPDAYIYLAKINMKLNRFDDSLKALNKSETLSSLNWKLYLEYAKFYFAQEMYLHAKNSVDKAIKLKGNEKILLELSKNISNKIENI